MNGVTPLLIAVVDDDESVRRALHRFLRSAGHAVETYTTGLEFLHSLEKYRPDCVVLDVHMPAISGFEVQSRMAAKGLRVPTVVITGHESPDSQQRALQGGASDFLRKPVDGHILLSAIERAVNSGGGGQATTEAHSP